MIYWLLLGHLGSILGHLGSILEYLGSNLEHFGSILGHLDSILGQLGSILEHFGSKKSQHKQTQARTHNYCCFMSSPGTHLFFLGQGTNKHSSSTTSKYHRNSSIWRTKWSQQFSLPPFQKKSHAIRSGSIWNRSGRIWNFLKLRGSSLSNFEFTTGNYPPGSWELSTREHERWSILLELALGHSTIVP